MLKLKQTGSSMVIAGLAALCVAIIGLFTLNADKLEPSSEATELNQASNNTNDPGQSSPDSDPAEDSSYTVTISKIQDGERQDFALLEVESDDRSHSKVYGNEDAIEFIIYDNYEYVKDSKGDNWTRYRHDGFSGNANYIRSLVLNDEDIAQIEVDARPLGEQQCGSKTCLAYVSEADGQTNQILIDKDTKQLVEASGEHPEIGNMVISYDFDTSVVIDLPKSYTESNAVSDEDNNEQE